MSWGGVHTLCAQHTAAGLLPQPGCRDDGLHRRDLRSYTSVIVKCEAFGSVSLCVPYTQLTPLGVPSWCLQWF